jgi:phage baseplate assembly protein W
MSYPVYYVPAGDVLPVFFDTFDGGTGASITMSGLAVTDIEIYKDGSVTQRASDAGYTLLDTDGIDFDSLTGIHGFSIDTGDDTDAGFFAVGAWYHVVVSAITIDAQTVSFIACAFRLMASESVAGVPEVDVTHIGGDAQSATDLKDFADAGYDPATNKVEGVKLADTLTTYTGNTVQTGDAYARLGAPAGASVSADIAAIEAQTDDIGAAGAGLTAIPWNAAWDAEVESEATDALNAYDPPTRAELTTDINSVIAFLQGGLVMVKGTIGSTGNDTTHVHLDGFTYGDDEINDMLIVIFDNSASEYHARWVTDWVLSTELATVATLPFTPENAVDTYWLLPMRQDVSGSGLDAAGVRAAVGLASANLDTQLAAIEAQTDDIGVAGAGLTAVPWNAAWDAEVESEATDALNAYDPPTNAELTTAQAAIIDGVLDAIRVSKNTALSNFEFFMRDSSDHVSGKTGLTVTSERSIDGGALASTTNSATEVGNGIYKINLSAADLNGDVVTFRFTGTGADPTVVTLILQPAD